MELEKISQNTFEAMKERAVNDPIERTGGGSYKFYHLVRRDNREIVRVNEYISEADGFPYDTVEYVSE